MKTYQCLLHTTSCFTPFTVRSSSPLGARRKALKVARVKVHKRTVEDEGVDYLTKDGRRLWVSSKEAKL